MVTPVSGIVGRAHGCSPPIVPGICNGVLVTRRASPDIPAGEQVPPRVCARSPAKSTSKPTSGAQGPVTVEGSDASSSLTPRHDGFKWVNGGGTFPAMGSSTVEARADGKVPRQAYP